MNTAQRVRDELGITQYRIAKTMGLSYQCLVSLWETGSVRPTADNAIRYITCLADLAHKAGRLDLAERLLGESVWILGPEFEPPDEEEYLERDPVDACLSCAVSQEFTEADLIELGTIAPHLLSPLAAAGRNTAMLARAFAALGHETMSPNKNDCSVLHVLAARAALNRHRQIQGDLCQ